MDTLGGAEFAPETVYLDTATCGLMPRRAADAVRRLLDDNLAGRGAGSRASVDAARASFARLVRVSPDRVAVGNAVAVHVGLIAACLPGGAEVLVPEQEFSSVASPFALRGDLVLRQVPLEKLADGVGERTALVAFSAVQSSDGRVADLPAIRAAAAAHGARTLVDASQATGWYPLTAGDWDFTVTGGFKFLMSPRGTSFLTVTEEAQEGLRPLHAGLLAAQNTARSTYGPVERLAAGARRFDEATSFLSYHAAEQSLALLEDIGVPALHAHATGLAARFRDGLRSLGHEPLSGDSAVVAVPGLGGRQEDLWRAGVAAADRAGNLRAAFHLYNASADVDRALDVLAG
jgi:selenocysteine lyase/cysteine desulfurase